MLTHWPPMRCSLESVFNSCNVFQCHGSGFKYQASLFNFFQYPTLPPTHFGFLSLKKICLLICLNACIYWIIKVRRKKTTFKTSPFFMFYKKLLIFRAFISLILTTSNLSKTGFLVIWWKFELQICLQW